MSATDILIEDERLTPLGFTRLLEWLDDGVESQGNAYVELRQRLVAYFDRRNRTSAEELADETLTRVAMTLEKAAIATRPPARYCYTIAKFVLLEDFRRERRHVRFDGEPPNSGTPPVLRQGALDPDDGRELRERRLACLDDCLQELTPERRSLVVEYYGDPRGQKVRHRRDLAARLGITMNALAVRACRIRAALERCVECRLR